MRTLLIGTREAVFGINGGVATLRRVVLAAALFSLASGGALSFEVNGFRAGMTVADARRLATAQGWQIQNIGQTADFIAHRNNVDGPLVYFCGGRLFLYSLSYSGEFPTFNRLIENETAIRGPARYHSQNIRIAEGESNRLSFYWNGSATRSVFSI